MNMKYLQGWTGTATTSLLATISWIGQMDGIVKVFAGIAAIAVAAMNFLHTLEQWRIRRIERKRLKDAG